MATMASLEQQAHVTPEIPRFDDGMVDIQELMRIMAESLVNEIMNAQAEDACTDSTARSLGCQTEDRAERRFDVVLCTLQSCPSKMVLT